MSYWNFRVCKEKYKGITSPDDVWELSVREVYYNDDGSIWAVSKEGISAHGEIDDTDEAAALKFLTQCLKILDIRIKTLRIILF